MKKILGILTSASLLVPALTASPVTVYASDCFADPIIEHNWTGTVTTGARVRDVACMDGSTVLTTLPVGTSVSLTGETDGWWKVKLADGTEGWVGATLIAKDEVTAVAVDAPVPTLYTAPVPTTDDDSSSEDESSEQTETDDIRTTHSEHEQQHIRDRVSGHILLEVERHGEAWYVDPKDDHRYYMKDGPTAYNMMRNMGLGISEPDFAKLEAGDRELKKRVEGRIVLRVHEHGEAYYINPADGSVTYLKDGDAAYSVMREKGLGITDNDLGSLPLGTLSL